MSSSVGWILGLKARNIEDSDSSCSKIIKDRQLGDLIARSRLHARIQFLNENVFPKAQRNHLMNESDQQDYVRLLSYADEDAEQVWIYLMKLYLFVRKSNQGIW